MPRATGANDGQRLQLLARHHQRNGHRYSNANGKGRIVKKQFNVLYRLFNKEGQLLYIGQSIDFGNRVRTHRRVQAWWVDVSFILLENYETLIDLKRAEVEAIKLEKPLENIVNNGLIDAYFHKTLRTNICQNCGKFFKKLNRLQECCSDYCDVTWTLAGSNADEFLLQVLNCHLAEHELTKAMPTEKGNDAT